MVTKTIEDMTKEYELVLDMTNEFKNKIAEINHNQDKNK